MASISSETASQRLLRYCLSQEPWPADLLREALLEDGGRTFLRVVVERLGDLFEPSLCQVYGRLFSSVIELVRPELRGAALLARYDRIRQPRVCSFEPMQVVVLSRITLGADVAVTSVLLDAAKRRFPKARICFAGAMKNGELFAADERIEVLPVSYPRSGSLIERIAAFHPLAVKDAIVIDTDSRITQLGLLPICDEARHFFFESRAFGGDSHDSLPLLAQRWAKQTFGVDANAYVATPPVDMDASIAVSFGVGENEEKRLDGTFEADFLRLLQERGQVVIDKGAGGEEAMRAEALARLIPNVRTYEGPYAMFAARIARAKLYVGYDSAGQHVASASGTPLVSIFAGYPSDRFVDRWRPKGTVIKATTPSRVLDEVSAALQNLTL
ncbi:MAG: glycosyltransferase family 9 protein [Bryobacteraceae bacterium]